MTNSFWFSNDGDVEQLPAVEPPYDIKESVRFDGEDNKLERTPADTDGQRIGETGAIQTVAFNDDGSVTLTVKDGLEPHQDLQGDYLQVGDTLTQDSAGSISTSSITSASTPYVIGDSVIFDGSSSYMSRTPSTVGNRKTWTWSGWVKRSSISGSTQRFFTATGGNNNDEWTAVFFSTNETLCIGGYSLVYRESTAKFRDPNRWHHIVVTYDLDNADSNLKVRAWVDGVIVDWETWSSTPTTGGVNYTVDHAIGAENGNSFYDGYIADVQLVDGLALEATTFGEYNSAGVWIPKAVDLTRVSPYDAAPNTSQVWQTHVSGSQYPTNVNVGPIAQVFDGRTTTYSAAATDSSNTFTNPVSNSTWKVYFTKDASAAPLLVNGVEYTTSPAEGTGQLDTVVWSTDASNQWVRVSGIELDGKLLVSWNTSDVWSNYASYASGGPDGTYVLANLFDGSTSTSAASANSSPIRFNPPAGAINITNTVEVSTNSPSGTVTVVTSTGTYSEPTEVQGNYVTVTTGAGTLVSVEISTSVGRPYANAIRVDGVFLVDPQDQWNTTKTWTAEVTESLQPGVSVQVGSLSNVFDGDLESYYYVSHSSANGPGITHTITFPSGVRASKVRVYNYLDSESGAVLNSTNPADLVAGPENTGWNTVYDGAETDVNYIAFGTPASGGLDNVISAIELDGEVLVDGGYGMNGFHLDFSSTTDIGEDSSGLDNDFTVNNLDAVSGTLLSGHSNRTYTGDSGSTVTIEGFGFNPDLIWIKNVVTAQDHCLYDTVRGVDRNQLNSNTTSVEASILNETGGVTSTTSDGFVLTGDNTINGGTNRADTCVAWCWDAGTNAPASNTDGSITTTVKTDGKFSIATWTTPAGVGTIGTGLPSADFVIIKTTNVTGDWYVWHKDLDNSSSYLRLNGTTGGISSDIFAGGGGSGNGLVSLGALGNPNAAMVAYSWAETPGMSKFGRFSGNSSTNTIDCGFEPVWVMIKRTDDDQWYITDAARGAGRYLFADTLATETEYGGISFTTDGFTLNTSNGGLNATSYDYLYVAFSAESVKISDKTLDSPIGFINAAGDAVGNYCTLNPLDRQGSNGTFSNGNLDLTNPITSWAMTRGTIGVSSGKWYYEVTLGNDQYSTFGILSTGYDMRSSTNNWANGTGTGTYALYPYSGNIYDGSVTDGISYADANTSGSGDVYGVAFDLDNGTVEFYRNGVSLGQAFTGVSGTYAPVAWLYDQSGSDSYNFGQKPWVHTPPAGYKALCHTNL